MQTVVPATPEQQEAIANISRFLTYMFPGNPIIELRARCADGAYRAGHYNDYTRLAKMAVYLEGHENARALYYSTNPVKLEAVGSIGGRKLNVFCNLRNRQPRCAGNNNIERRLVYYIDVDPIRPSDIMATASEKSAAEEVAHSVVDYLRSHGWPEPVIVDSGSGYHLLYRADGCPTDEEHTAVWKHCVAHLGKQFDSEAVHIDPSVTNPGRIARLPYCWNRKGASTEERPHRKASVVSYPEQWVTLDSTEVKRFAIEKGFDPSTVRKPRSGAGSATTDDMTTFIDDCFEDHDFSLDVSEVEQRGGDTYYHLEQCPFEGYQHPGNGHKTSLMIRSGSPGFECFADQCSNRTFGDLLDLIEEQSGERPVFGRLREDHFTAWGMSMDDLSGTEVTDESAVDEAPDEPELASVMTVAEETATDETATDEPVVQDTPASETAPPFIPTSYIEQLRGGLKKHPAAVSTDWTQCPLTSHPMDWGLTFDDVKSLYTAAALSDINKLPPERRAGGCAITQDILHRHDLKAMGARLGHQWFATLAIRKAERQRKSEKPMTIEQFRAIAQEFLMA